MRVPFAVPWKVWRPVRRTGAADHRVGAPEETPSPCKRGPVIALLKPGRVAILRILC